MRSPSAHGLQALKRRGIEVSKLGCVMLDVEGPRVVDQIDTEDAYVSDHPDRAWISGVQSEHHVTLLYGLLDNANTIKDDIAEVLHGWKPGLITASTFGTFDSPWEDEPYTCIVAHLEVTADLLDAHQRLSMLPHVNTYPTFRPHVTLAYVREDRAAAVLSLLQYRYRHGMLFAAGELNYGYLPEEKS